MKKRNIIIDCDPGIDDTVALSFAIANEDKLNILGITTVAGNQTIEKVTLNALRIVSYYKRNIKIAMGQGRPLIREKSSGGSIHGEDGLGDCSLPEPALKLYSDNAITFLRDTIMAQDEKVTLVPVGPLTNIALLIKVFPEVKEKIELISLMGGSTIGGNRTPYAEYNVWADPEAARIVFDSRLPIVMSGLTVTLSAGLYKDDVEILSRGGGKATGLLGRMLDYYFRGDHVKKGTFTPIHDACALMYLLYPQIFEFRHTEVLVDCSEGLNRGNTAVDMRDWVKYDTTYPKVLTKVDTEKFRKILLNDLYKLDGMV
jgi:pyrimidine-specific ribonucleoside hydrolase